MRHVQDSRQILLAPVDGEREAGHQHHHGLRIGGVDLLHEFFHLQIDGAPVDRLLAVARRRALLPAGIARGVVPDEYHGHVGLFRRLDRRVIVVVRGIVHGDAGAEFSLDAFERSNRVGRSAAVPIQQHFIGARADHRDGFQL